MLAGVDERREGIRVAKDTELSEYLWNLVVRERGKPIEVVERTQRRTGKPAGDIPGEDLGTLVEADLVPRQAGARTVPRRDVLERGEAGDDVLHKGNCGSTGHVDKCRCRRLAPDRHQTGAELAQVPDAVSEERDRWMPLCRRQDRRHGPLVDVCEERCVVERNAAPGGVGERGDDRKSTRLNSSHVKNSYA